jgi:hypothetical protein
MTNQFVHIFVSGFRPFEGRIHIFGWDVLEESRHWLLGGHMVGTDLASEDQDLVLLASDKSVDNLLSDIFEDFSFVSLYIR